jgi:hypothetical protein
MEIVSKTPERGMQLEEPAPKCEVAAIYGGRSVASRLRWFIGLVGVTTLLAAFAVPANAGLLATGAASYCDPYSSTAFQGWGDWSNYMLTPGGSFEDGAPTWKLAGGAKVVSGNEPYFIHAKGDRRSLYMPAGSSASTPTMCFAAGDWHLRFVGTGSGQLRVTITVNSLLGVVSILDGGTVANNGIWKPSPKVGLLLTNVGGLLTTKAISIRFTATSGASQLDDVYLDPFKDT